MTKPLLTRLIIPIVLFLLIITANFPIDIHVPAMPIIAKELNASISYVQLTVSLFLLGYGFFPLLYGSLSDAYGRRKIAMVALFVLFIGSIFCSLATSMVILLIGRFIQGAGAAGCMCISRSIMRDSFQQRIMAQVSSLIGIGIELTLACSPLIGGYLVHSFGWHSNFTFVLILTLIVWFVIFFCLEETNKQFHKEAIKLSVIIDHSKAILKNRIFIRYVLCTAAAFSVGIGFFTISPFVIQNALHYSAKMYGLISLIVTGAIVLGSFTNAYLVKHLGIEKMMFIGLFIVVVSGISLMVFALSFPITLVTFIVPSALAFFGLAFLFGNCMAGALQPFPKQAGLASSIYSTIQIITSFVATMVIILSPHNNSEFLAFIFLVTSILALWNFYRTRKAS